MAKRISATTSRCDQLKERVRPSIPSQPPLECDLVMKGGITSGIVYPAAVLELAQRYRFRNIGGTSVGAIAAAVVAAAEYGRQRGVGTAFEELEALNEEMQREGFVLARFQPVRAARPAFDLLIASMRNPGSKGRKRLGMAGAAIRAAWKPATVTLAIWLGFQVALGVALGSRWWVLPAAAGGWGIVLGLLLAGRTRRIRSGLGGAALGFLSIPFWPLAVAPVSLGLSLYRALNEHGFGMCPGLAQTGSASSPGLTEWLHDHIQKSAGRTTDGSTPLTFGDLLEAGIDLQMMTTNLSTARPVRLPVEAEDYLFLKEDLAGLFPPHVVEHVAARSRPVPDADLTSAGFRLMPLSRDLPILVGFRMSLSFPVLFTAVKLYSLHPQDPKRAVPNWFSDGGVGSNFPIHFFDAWLPSRPTFGLSLGPYPQDPDGKAVPGSGDIGLPEPPTSFRVPDWINISTIGSFLHQVMDTMQNWRDNMQSELPGFQDRVFQVRLAGEEGGLNMSKESICDLILKGSEVGKAITGSFDMDQHFFTRYVTFMQMMQIGLIGEDDQATGLHRRGVIDSFAPYRDRFLAGNPGARDLFGHDEAWCRQAAGDTWALAENARAWIRPSAGGTLGFVGFDSGLEPRPKPSMRIVPKV